MTIQWTALYGKPVVQRRVSIARPPGPPKEDCDVLVLNSRSTSPDPSVAGAQVLYLDLRLSHFSTVPVGINWAFAGMRETIVLEEEEDNAMRYYWRHAIDSHGKDEPPDEGTMVKCKDENGETIEVETGMGLDPDTGKIGRYEEVWREDNVSSGAPFAFLTQTTEPDQSSRFLAIIDLHAVGLWQSAADGRAPTCDGAELEYFHAVRLRRDTKNLLNGESLYSKVFSTGYQILENQLENFVEELRARVREGRQLWKRGETLALQDVHGKDLTWIVWDAGYVAH